MIFSSFWYHSGILGFLHVKFIADFRTMVMACSGCQFGLCRWFTYRTIIPPTLESTGMLNPALLIPALPDPDPDPNPENSNVSSNTSNTNMHSMNECMNTVEQEFYQNICSG